MGSVREDIAKELYYQNFRLEARGRVVAWERKSNIIQNGFRKDADQILSLVCKRIEGVELTWEEIEAIDLKNAESNFTDALIDTARAQLQAILDVIKEE